MFIFYILLHLVALNMPVRLTYRLRVMYTLIIVLPFVFDRTGLRQSYLMPNE